MIERTDRIAKPGLARYPNIRYNKKRVARTAE
jgi:hypothetical protein